MPRKSFSQQFKKCHLHGGQEFRFGDIGGKRQVAAKFAKERVFEEWGLVVCFRTIGKVAVGCVVK